MGFPVVPFSPSPLVPCPLSPCAVVPEIHCKLAASRGSTAKAGESARSRCGGAQNSGIEVACDRSSSSVREPHRFQRKPNSMVKNGIRICSVCRTELPDGAFCHELTFCPEAVRSFPTVSGIAEECAQSPDGTPAVHLCWECYLGLVPAAAFDLERRSTVREPCDSAARESAGLVSV